MSAAPDHPPKPTDGPLAAAWDQPVCDLVRVKAPLLPAEQVERHSLYCYLVMALITHYWNGNKRGSEGTYPWREKQRRPDGTGYAGGDYLGHNIAAIAVDGDGDVIDFDFNHNDLLNSSVEHAESRLIRRVFSLTQLHDDWATRPAEPPRRARSYSTVLSNVSIYTSLESCSQCSGIMALGSVKEVVFLHRDPGQNSIGNILRNLGLVGDRYLAPLPVPADVLGLPCFAALERAYTEFSRNVGERPFYRDAAGSYVDRVPSITSFLCTDLARDIFATGAQTLANLTQVRFPAFKPRDEKGVEIQAAKSNAEVLAHVKRFLAYATTDGRRGTPHKL